MAYLNLLASVPETDVERLRCDPDFRAKPTRISGASHLLAYWIKSQPLGGLLNRALDGGERIRSDLSHVFRPPVYHPPHVVRELLDAIAPAWSKAVEQREALMNGIPADEDEWLTLEMRRLLLVFRHAAERSECIVSALDSPPEMVERLWAERQAR